MNLHEYQGKAILEKYGVPIQKGFVADTPAEAVEGAKRLFANSGLGVWVVKAQVHAGGRGKAGGVKMARSYEEVEKCAREIIGMQLVTKQTGPKGKPVRKVLVEESIYAEGPENIKEYYIGILLDRNTGHNMIVYSPRGGMDIEQVAEETPEMIFKEEVDPAIGLQAFQCRRVAFNFGLEGDEFKRMVGFVAALYKAYVETDASMLEINPVAKSSDGKIVAADTKFVVDNSSLYRHPDIAAMRDFEQEDPTEVEAGKFKLNFVKLDGNVGCMVNGAGLAMATMDIIKLSGGEPANFLDVGGSADAKRVEEGFRIILKDPNVKAILVNIFGGIVRCDRVANGIVEAYKNIGEIKVPIIVRLQGTNAEEAKKIIDKSGLKVFSAVTLQDAADKVNEVVSKK